MIAISIEAYKGKQRFMDLAVVWKDIIDDGLARMQTTSRPEW
ncbi:MAG: hypothetical protein RQ885_06945 [Desulfurococcales archaeon]|jgi:hypothetical protein|nr:hypothetical protein [Desulfurococcales archaeon]